MLGDGLAAVVFFLLSIPFILAAVLNISNLVSVKQLEDEPEQTDYSSQYVEQNFYGYENDGELVFVLDNTYVMFYWLPRMEITQVYEGNHDIDVCLYNRQFKCLHIRDMKWQFWKYYLEDGKLEGPFE